MVSFVGIFFGFEVGIIAVLPFCFFGAFLVAGTMWYGQQLTSLIEIYCPLYYLNGIRDTFQQETYQ